MPSPRGECAKATASTRSLPPSRSARAHAAIVAPVVITSSTRTALRGAAARGARAAVMRAASPRGRPTWRGPWRRRRQGSKGEPCAAGERERDLLGGVEARARRRSGAAGTGTTFPRAARRCTPAIAAAVRVGRASADAGLERRDEPSRDTLVGRRRPRARSGPATRSGSGLGPKLPPRSRFAERPAQIAGAAQMAQRGGRAGQTASASRRTAIASALDRSPLQHARPVRSREPNARVADRSRARPSASLLDVAFGKYDASLSRRSPARWPSRRCRP